MQASDMRAQQHSVVFVINFVDRHKRHASIGSIGSGEGPLGASAGAASGAPIHPTSNHVHQGSVGTMRPSVTMLVRLSPDHEEPLHFYQVLIVSRAWYCLRVYRYFAYKYPQPLRKFSCIANAEIKDIKVFKRWRNRSERAFRTPKPRSRVVLAVSPFIFFF